MDSETFLGENAMDHSPYASYASEWNTAASVMVEPSYLEEPLLEVPVEALNWSSSWTEMQDRIVQDEEELRLPISIDPMMPCQSSHLTESDNAVIEHTSTAPWLTSVASVASHTSHPGAERPQQQLADTARSLLPEMSGNQAASTTSGIGSGSTARGNASIRHACIGCRNSKASCDAQRPCSRCTRLGRPCVDRSAEDIAAALARRRHQTPGTAPALKPSAKRKPRHQAPSRDENPDHKAQKYFAPAEESNVALMPAQASRTLLQVLEIAQLRDRFLAMEAAVCSGEGDFCAHGLGSVTVGRVGASITRNTPAGVRRSLHLCLLQLSSSLSCADFTRFIVGDLDDHQRHSVEFLSSVLAMWAVPATRPLRFDFSSSPNCCVVIPEAAKLIAIRDDNPADPACSSSARTLHDAVPALHLEFAPDAYETFLRWDDNVALRQANTREPTSSTVAHERSNSASSAQSYLAPVHVGIHCLNLHDEPPKVNRVKEDPDKHHRPPSDDDTSECPSIGTTAPAPSEPSHHASWCDSRNTLDANGVSHDTSALPSGSAVPPSGRYHWRSRFCSCALSVPLPAVVQVNRAFEELFGLTAADIKRGFQEHGMGFMTCLYPACEWSSLQRSQLADLLGAPFSNASLSAPIFSAPGPTPPEQVVSLSPSTSAARPEVPLLSDHGVLLSELTTRVLCYRPIGGPNQTSSQAAGLIRVRLAKRITHRNGFMAHTLLWHRSDQT